MLKVIFTNSGIPEISFTTNSQALYYTILIRSTTELQYLVINSNKQDINNGNIILGYTGVPYDGSYVAEVYEQLRYIDPKLVSLKTFNFQEFLYTNGLRLIAQDILHASTCNRQEDPKGFVTGNVLSEKQKNYCRCTLHVAQKGNVNNPYAVCAKSVGTTFRDCWKYYDFDKMPSAELRYYATKHHFPTGGLSDCQIAESMKQWQRNKT